MKKFQSGLIGSLCCAGLGCMAAAAFAQSAAKPGQATTADSTPAAAAIAPTTAGGGFWAPALADEGNAFGGQYTFSRSSAAVRSSQLAQKFVKADKASDKEEIKKQLSEQLSNEFDEHLKQQQKEIEELDKQLAALKATLKKRQDNKGTIVVRRFEQLVQEAEGLGWNSPRGLRARNGMPLDAVRYAPAAISTTPAPSSSR